MKKSVIIFSLFALGFISQSCVVHTKPTSLSHRTTKVVIIKKAPKNHKIVIVKGKRYYFWNGKHYRKTSKGYVFVRV